MPIRIGAQAWRGNVVGGALVVVGLAVSGAAVGANGSPPAAPASAGESESLAARRGIASPLRHDREEARRSVSSRRGRGETWGEHWEHFGERMERHWSRVGERTADRGHDWEEIAERVGERWGAFGERAGERWGAFGERAGDRWSGFGARAGRRWSRIGNQMGRRFEEMAEDLPEVIELSIETVLDALDTLLASLGHE